MKSVVMILSLIFAICNLTSAFTTIKHSNRSCRSLIGTKRSTTKSTFLLATAGEGAPKKKATKKKATKTATTKKAAEPVEEDNEEGEVVTFRKPEFVTKIAEKTGMSKSDSEAALSAVLETITEVRFSITFHL